MANRTYTYEVYWAYKTDGNRTAEDCITVKATTVQRAISKAVKEINNGVDPSEEDYLKTADLLIISVDNINWKAN
jgi:hypothetical protein